MNTSVHIPEGLAVRLTNYLEQRGSVSKNSIIVTALEKYLDTQEKDNSWSTEFLAWGGGEEEKEGLELDRDWDTEREDIFI